MKRALSESDFDDEEFIEQEKGDIGSEGKDAASGDASARKKRRGLIEKKRRDRINTCLAELRRLVPAAVEKQGSAKLEKAEILQLTVEHLKAIKCTELAGQGVPLMRPTDHHYAGFQHCIAETARYLYNMDIPEVHDPRRVQLINQLHNGTQPNLTGQATPRLASPFPRVIQDVWLSQKTDFSPQEAPKTESTKENYGPQKNDFDDKDSPPSDEPRLPSQGQFSLPLKYPTVLPLHAPNVINFPLSFLSPAMTEWSFSAGTKSNIKAPPLFNPWSPQLFGSQTSNITFRK